jgi:hypothetical protein
MPTRAAIYGMVLLLCVQPAPKVHVAESLLAGTWWAANRACAIMDMLFQADGRVTVLFANGHDGFGRWRLQGNVVTIAFDYLDDTFLGRLSDMQIRASHTWQENGQRRDEECSFEQVRQGPSA